MFFLAHCNTNTQCRNKKTSSFLPLYAHVHAHKHTYTHRKNIISTMLPRGVFLQSHHALEMQNELFHWTYNISEAQQTHSDQDMPVPPMQIHQINAIMSPNDSQWVTTIL